MVLETKHQSEERHEHHWEDCFSKTGESWENKSSWPQCFSQIYLTSTAQHLWTPSLPPLQLAPNMPGYFVVFGPMRQTRCTLDINTSTCIMHVKSSVTESYIGCGQTVQGLWDPAEQMWCSSCRTQWLNQGSVWYFFLYSQWYTTSCVPESQVKWTLKGVFPLFQSSTSTPSWPHTDAIQYVLWFFPLLVTVLLSFT